MVRRLLPGFVTCFTSPLSPQAGIPSPRACLRAAASFGVLGLGPGPDGDGGICAPEPDGESAAARPSGGAPQGSPSIPWGRTRRGESVHSKGMNQKHLIEIRNGSSHSKKRIYIFCIKPSKQANAQGTKYSTCIKVTNDNQSRITGAPLNVQSVNKSWVLTLLCETLGGRSPHPPPSNGKPLPSQRAVFD